jgi:hypothetical protein
MLILYEGIQIMGKLKNAIIEILNHGDCYGQGWQFAGNDIDYDVWACECNPYNIPADEIYNYNALFTTKENA